MSDDEAVCTIKGARLLEVSKDGAYGVFEIPGVGRRRFHQSAVHDDSELYWSMTRGKVTMTEGLGKLVLKGWYAERQGLELD